MYASLVARVVHEEECQKVQVSVFATLHTVM